MTIEQLYEQRRMFIFKIRHYVKNYDIAEDLVQDAFARALDKFHQYDKAKGTLKGWFTKVLFSIVWAHMRELKRRPPIYNIDLVLESDLLAYGAEPNLREYVQNVHNTSHKQALLGYFVLGNTYQEISAVLGMSVDNVRKIVQRFRDGEKV